MSCLHTDTVLWALAIVYAAGMAIGALTVYWRTGRGKP